MTDPAQVIYEKGKLYDLNISDLQPDPDQPRKYFDEQALAELKASIEKHSVLQLRSSSIKSPFKKGDLVGFAFGSLCSVFKRPCGWDEQASPRRYMVQRVGSRIKTRKFPHAGILS
jgi:hypothetical protein